LLPLPNIGTEAYAYFTHIINFYSFMRASPRNRLIAFVQGGADEENKWIASDIMNLTANSTHGNLTFASLSGQVRGAWRFADPWKTPGYSDIVRMVAPEIFNLTGWTTVWRGMFAVSYGAILTHTVETYLSLRRVLEDMLPVGRIKNVRTQSLCKSSDCFLETLFGPIFQCNPDAAKKRLGCTESRGPPCLGAPGAKSCDFEKIFRCPPGKDGMMKVVGVTSRRWNGSIRCFERQAGNRRLNHGGYR
jgi:hypothetical protein